MTDKELLSQLNNLKNIKPDQAWKTRSRDILLSQISGGDYAPLPPKPAGFSLEYYFKTFFHQPVLVVSTILLVVMGGGIFSVNASRDTKPGDSLYIAKIISEKTRAAITFNEEEKAKLGLEFAGNRAKEMTRVMSEDENGDKEKKMEKLAQNFKKEISAAKDNLKKINIIKEEGVEDDGANESSPVEEGEDTQIFSANLGKDDKGMTIYDPNKKDEKVIEAEGEADTGEAAETEIVETLENIKEEIASSTPANSGDMAKVLEDAEKMFDEKNYDGALNKLEEANSIIDNIDENKTDNAEDEVNNSTNSQSEQATTTEVDVLKNEEEK